MPYLFDQTRILYAFLKSMLRREVWFPHLPIAAMVVYGSIYLLRVDLGRDWTSFYKNAETGAIVVSPALLPLVLIGGGMIFFSIGLVLRSRIAWIMTLLLASSATISTVLGRAEPQYGPLIYFALTLLALVKARRCFDRTSLAASTLFAVTATFMLLFYGTFGSFYLGQQFKPPITDLVNAFYYAMVTMTTVGYGDILPVTPESKLFAVSVIMLGVAIFATSLTAVITPLVNNSINRIVLRKDRRMQRSKHFIIIGNTPLAMNTSRELRRRGMPVTRVLKEDINDIASKGVDVIIGDASDIEILREAGADKAECVLAMKADDSENAFIVLAVREFGTAVRTVIAINDEKNMDRVRLVQPDVVIAPNVLGGELVAMMLAGETISPEFLMERIFQKIAPVKR